MLNTNKYLLSSLFLLVSVSILFSFIEIKKEVFKNKIKDQSSGVQKPGYSVKKYTSECDPGLWKYVYNPKRLQVIDKCITVTGIIKESRPDTDGDQHMLLDLDKGQEKLLTKKNLHKKNGYLVIEAVCMNKVKDHKVGNTCKGYSNQVHIPKVGDHVKVTGSYVVDSHNGWAEIHPISRIETQ